MAAAMTTVTTTNAAADTVMTKVMSAAVVTDTIMITVTAKAVALAAVAEDRLEADSFGCSVKRLKRSLQ